MWLGSGLSEISVPFARFCCEHRTAQKNKVKKRNKTQKRKRTGNIYKGYDRLIFVFMPVITILKHEHALIYNGKKKKTFQEFKMLGNEVVHVVVYLNNPEGFSSLFPS